MNMGMGEHARSRPGDELQAPKETEVELGKPLSYLALNGSLGTGFEESSLERALRHPLAFIGVDSGSTDGGPYYLGTGQWIWTAKAYQRDLRLGLRAARHLGVPLVVGSCGGGGGDGAVEGFADMVDQIGKEERLRLKVACITCEPDRSFLAAKYRRGQLRALPGAPHIDEATFSQPGHIVAMAGAEPIQEALEQGADVVLVGRCADAAIFAALPLAAGFDPGAVWNAAKIVECGSAAAANRRGQDCLMCTLDEDGFVLEPLDPELRCTPMSVGAHTLYETADPYRLVLPSGTLDARTATYQALDPRRVRVRGGTFSAASEYTAKLEGAAPVGFLSSFWGTVEDPVLLSQLEQWCRSLKDRLHQRFEATWGKEYQLDLKVYGGAALGDAGRTWDQAVIVLDVIAPSQEEASGMARAGYHLALHWPVPEWRAGSITTFAHPYSAPVADRGEVFRFTLNHQVVLEPHERAQVFRTTVQQMGAR